MKRVYGNYLIVKFLKMKVLNEFPKLTSAFHFVKTT